MADGETKICSGCRQPKPRVDFHNSTTERDGKRDYCKVCDHQGRKFRKHNKRLKELSAKVGKHDESQLKTVEQMLLSPACTISNRELLDELLDRWGGLPGVASDIHSHYVNCAEHPAQRTRILELIVRMIHQDEKLNGAKDPERMSDAEIAAEKRLLVEHLLNTIGTSQESNESQLILTK